MCVCSCACEEQALLHELSVRSRQLYGCACEEQALLRQFVAVEVCEEQIVGRGGL
jgi:hypothetical protein